MRGLYFVVVLAFLFVLPFASSGVNDGSCVDYDSTCGVGLSISSLLGYGAVELCSDCFRCGADDGVCPEDFANTTGSYANCHRCPDPDCLVTLSGFVFNDIGDPVDGVNVSASFPHITSLTYSTTTDATGHYSFSVPRGLYSVRFSALGYTTRIIDFPYNISEPRNDDYELNVTLLDGSCTTDCTGYTFEGETALCDRNCQGYAEGGSSCSFPSWDGSGHINFPLSYNATDYCHEIPSGNRVLVAHNGSYSLSVTCCQGPFAVEYRPALSLFSHVKNLIDFKTALRSDEGLTYVHIVTYST